MAVEQIGTIQVTFNADIQNFISGVRQVKAETESAGRNLERLSSRNSQLSASFGGVVNAAKRTAAALAVATTAAGALVASAINIERKFELTMIRVGAVARATRYEFENLRQTALDMSTTTMFGATQIAEGMQFMAMAGFSAREVQDGLAGVLQLSTAAMVDMGKAADIATNILVGFGMSTKDLGRVNDVLVGTFTRSNTNIRQLGDAFKYAGPVARASGISFEETAAAIGLLGNAGFQGEMGGTALRGAMTRLLAPTKQVQETMDSLGLDVKNANGTLKSLTQIVAELERSGADAGDMLLLFGQRAGPGMLNLVSQGSGALNDLTYALEQAAGEAAALEAKVLDSLEGKLENMKARVVSLAIAYADQLSPAVKGAVDMLNANLDAVLSNQDGIESFAAGSLRKFVAGWAYTAEAIKVVTGVIMGMAVPIFAVAEVIDFTVRSLIFGWDAILGGAEKAWGVIIGNTEKYTKRQAEMMKSGGALKASVDALGSSAKEIADMYNGLSSSLDSVTDGMFDIYHASNKTLSEQNQFRKEVKALDGQVQQLVDGGLSEYAAKLTMLENHWEDIHRIIGDQDAINKWLFGPAQKKAPVVSEVIKPSGGRGGRDRRAAADKAAKNARDREKALWKQHWDDIARIEAGIHADRMLQMKWEHEASQARIDDIVAVNKAAVDGSRAAADAVIADYLAQIAHQDYLNELRQEELDILEKKRLAMLNMWVGLAVGMSKGAAEGFGAAGGAFTAGVAEKERADDLAYLQKKLGLESDYQEQLKLQAEIQNHLRDQHNARVVAELKAYEDIATGLGKVAEAIGVAAEHQWSAKEGAEGYVAAMHAASGMAGAMAQAFGASARETLRIQAVVNAVMAAAALGMFAMTLAPQYLAAAGQFAASSAAMTLGSMKADGGSVARAPYTSAAGGGGSLKDEIVEAIKESGLLDVEGRRITNNYYTFDPVEHDRKDAQAQRLRVQQQRAQLLEI